MKKYYILLTLICLMMTGLIKGQTYSLVIKGGHVIDPKNNIDAAMDVAINNGKIALVAKNIDEKEGKLVINAINMYITPGLIDMHTHVFWGTNLDQQYMNGPNAVAPDGFTFRNGVTTIVDAGSSGWKSFPAFKKQTIDKSKTRVLAFLNIVGEGMRGDPYEQNLTDMDAQVTGEFARNNADYIVGIKVAHYFSANWTPVDRGVEAGKLANVPVMIDFGGCTPPLPLEDLLLKHLRPGDIFTHCFAKLASGREWIVDLQTNKLKPYALEAYKRGIIFDIGYGNISFAFSQAIPAIKSGFYPNTISTDLHISSMNGAMKDMLTTMSKFLAMGMDLQSVIKASTMTPAKIIQREKLGNLSVGSDADIAILSLRKGKFGLFDYTGYKIMTDTKLECEMTIKAGRIVYDLNGLEYPLGSADNKSFK